MNLQNELNNFDLPNEDLIVPFTNDDDVELLATRSMKVELTETVFQSLAELMNFTQPTYS